MIRLIRTFHRHAQVVGLPVREPREPDTQFGEMEPGNLFAARTLGY